MLTVSQRSQQAALIQYIAFPIVTSVEACIGISITSCLCQLLLSILIRYKTYRAAGAYENSVTSGSNTHFLTETVSGNRLESSKTAPNN